MKTRIIAGVCMIPLLALVYLGGIWLCAIAIFVAFVGVREFYDGFRAMDVQPSFPIAVCALISLYLIHGLNLYHGTDAMNETAVLAWLVCFIMISFLYMFRITRVGPVDSMATLTGIVYVIFFSYHVVLVDNTGEYRILIWLIPLAAFGSDIFAYFTGMAIGKHKLCPNLSPKKTIEGAVGGVIGSAVLCGIFGAIVCPHILIHCVIIGLVGSPISMCGDLTASAFKRKMGIKDYGDLIPGHGGIMDRFDSILFVAPFVYYYIIIVLGSGYPVISVRP